MAKKKDEPQKIDFEAIQFEEAPAGGAISFEEEEQDGLTQALSAVGKGLDYLGGAAVRGPVGLATGTMTPEEYKRALKGQDFFPDSATLLERGGMGTGGKLSESDLLGWLFEDESEQDTWRLKRDGLLDLTGRGTLGFALDTATDPLNLVSFGGASAAKQGARKAFRAVPKTRGGKIIAAVEGAGDTAADLLTAPARGAYTAAQRVVPKTMSAIETVARFPSKALTSMGKKAYAGGLAPLVEAGARKGKDVAETFYRYGIGSVPETGGKLRKEANKLKLLRDELLTMADYVPGAEVDKVAAWDEAAKVLKDAVDNRRISLEDADKIARDWVELYGPGGNPKPSMASTWKTDARHGVPGNAWNDVKTKRPDVADKVAMAWGKGLQEGTEKSVGKALGETSEKNLKGINSDLGDMLTVLEKAGSFANKTQKPLDVLDYMILSGEMAAPGFQGWELFAGKKLLQLMNTNSARMRTGRALRRAGESQLFGPAADIAIRRQWIDRSRPKKEDENEE